MTGRETAAARRDRLQRREAAALGALREFFLASGYEVEPANPSARVDLVVRGAARIVANLHTFNDQDPGRLPPGLVSRLIRDSILLLHAARTLNGADRSLLILDSDVLPRMQPSVQDLASTLGVETILLRELVPGFVSSNPRPARQPDDFSVVLQTLRLSNFGGFGRTEVPLDSNLTVLFGENGTGKSSAIRATVLLLQRFAARIGSPTSPGSRLSPLDIRVGEQEARIALDAHLPARNEPLAWEMVATVRGHEPDYPSQGDDLRRTTNDLRDSLTFNEDSTVLPVFAYYSVRRFLGPVPRRRRRSERTGRRAALVLSGLGDATLQFRSFFDWFVGQDDLRTERRRTDPDYAPQLMDSVRHAVTTALGDYDDLCVRHAPLRLEITKRVPTGEIALRLEQLSDGERNFALMVADLATRFVALNPKLPNPLEASGVVLIDELELHLHPLWQRSILARLRSLFPGAQFIVSTHSPQVIGETDGQIVDMGRGEDGAIAVGRRFRGGWDSNRVLEQLMGVEARPARALGLLQEVDRNLEKRDIAVARNALRKVRGLLGAEDPEVLRREWLIELAGKDDDEADPR